MFFCTCSGACTARRMTKELLARKRPLKCINYHPEEIEIQQCGGGRMLNAVSSILLIVVAAWTVYA